LKSWRSTSHAVPSKADPADIAIAEAFMLANGRWPEKGDGEAWEARRRCIIANTRAAATTPPLPNEPADSAAWRHQAATRWLVRQKIASKMIPTASVAPQTRSRESSSRRRAEMASRSGDGRDRPPSSVDLTRRRRGRRRTRWGAS
jgi:hypothetical protein